MPTDQRHPLGVTDTPEPRSARQTINDMLDAGLLDELMDRVDAGELTLTGEGGFLPEMVKAVLERGLAAELTEHLGTHLPHPTRPRRPARPPSGPAGVRRPHRPAPGPRSAVPGPAPLVAERRPEPRSKASPRAAAPGAGPPDATASPNAGGMPGGHHDDHVRPG